MKYLVRSLKYFVYLSIVLVLFISILVALGFVEGSIDQIFRHGMDSLWQMAIIVAVFAGVYPMIGYGKRNVRISGNPEENWEEVVKFMAERGYVLVEGDFAGAKFRRASMVSRVLKMWEDAVVFTPTFGGYALEGITKDIVRLDTGLTQRFDSAE